jgi:hypothetical protein
MRNLISLFALFYILYPVYGQDYSNNSRATVFTDSANVRESASLKAKILTTLRHGTEVILCEKGRTTDTINGKWGRWLPILHQNTSGYMWQNTLCDLVETHKNGNTLLARNSKEGLTYKVLEDLDILEEGSYTDSARQKYSGLMKMDIDTVPAGTTSFRITHSPTLYAFDGYKVYKNGSCNLNESNEFHSNFTKKFTDSLGVVILNPNTAFMIAPNAKSQLLANIPQYSFVAPTSAPPFKDTINGKLVQWQRVKWQGQAGYILGRSLGYRIKHIYDHKDTSTSYLLTNKAILVLQDRKPVAHAPVSWLSYDNNLHSFGDKGFGEGFNFIAIEFVAHSCGQTGGDMYYLWDGKSIKYFCFDSGTGDGSFSESDHYVFPKNHNLGANTIIHHSSASEMLDIIPANDCEPNYTDVDDYEFTAVMQFIDDTLIEVESKYLRARQFIEQQLPGQNSIRMTFTDINSDGNEDLIFQSINKIENPEYYDYGSINELENTTIGIAFGSNNNEFKMKFTNQKLISDRVDNRVKWTFNNGSFNLNTFYIPRRNRYNDYPKYERINYTFEYNTEEDVFYWKAVTVIDKNGVNRSTFKSKKILFENAWPFETDGY